jgi:hypothetical protein
MLQTAICPVHGRDAIAKRLVVHTQQFDLFFMWCFSFACHVHQRFEVTPRRWLFLSRTVLLHEDVGCVCGAAHYFVVDCSCMYACLYVCMYVCMLVAPWGCRLCLRCCTLLCCGLQLHACMLVCMYVCMHAGCSMKMYVVFVVLHITSLWIATACMHACMYVWCVCTHACMHVCMYACLLLHEDVGCVCGAAHYLFVDCGCMHVCLYACMYVCMYVCMLVAPWRCRLRLLCCTLLLCGLRLHACMVCMHARMYACMHACVCIYILSCCSIKITEVFGVLSVTFWWNAAETSHAQAQAHNTHKMKTVEEVR